MPASRAGFLEAALKAVMAFWAGIVVLSRANLFTAMHLHHSFGQGARTGKKPVACRRPRFHECCLARAPGAADCASRVSSPCNRS